MALPNGIGIVVEEDLSRPVTQVTTPNLPSSLSVNRVAYGAVGRYVVVKQVGSKGISPVSRSVRADEDLILGVTINAASHEGVVSVRLAGEIYEPSWNWTPGPIYCGPQGELTQAPSTTGWLRQVAVALSSDLILVGIQIGGDSTAILHGRGEPSVADGEIGDFYLDLINYQLFGPKTLEGWSDSVVLKGPEGPKGEVGASGQVGPQGPAGPPGPIGSVEDSGVDFVLLFENKLV